MSKFNHKKAWRELVAPALMGLPQNILQLVLLTMKESRGIQQRQDLSLPWPEASFLKERLEALPAEELAKSARIVWSAGHWHPGSDNWFRPLMRTGTYWKFSTYADQVLREKCKLVHADFNSEFSFEIHEGFLRACVDFDDTWEWQEIALATPENLKKAKVLVPKSLTRKESGDIRQKSKHWDVINDAINKMKLLRPTNYTIMALPKPALIEHPIARFFDLSEFYDINEGLRK
jgi:hypothetical protein